MGWGAVTDFVSDNADAVGDAASDAWNSASDVASDAWDGASDLAGDAWDSAEDFASDSWESTKSVLGHAGEYLGDALETTAETVDDATGGALSDTMNMVDDYVFDTVDEYTGGVIDIDYDDGTFSGNVGIDGVAGVGASIGEHGVTANGEIPGAEMEVGLTDDGLTASTEMGIDWGPLPYVDGHVEFTDDGEVSIGGKVQGTLPTPVGVLTGEAEGGYVETEEATGGFVDAGGTLYAPSGTTVSGGVEASYVETDEGSHTSVGVDGEVSQAGVGSVGGGVSYERLEQGDDVIQHVEGEVRASGYGTEVEAEAGYTHAEVGGEEHSEWSGDIDVDLPWDNNDQVTDEIGGDIPDIDENVVLGSDTPDAQTGTQVLTVDDGALVAEPAPGVEGTTTPTTSTGGEPAPTVAEPDPAPVPEPEPEPDAFDQAIASADELESSVDDLFDDVQ